MLDNVVAGIDNYEAGRDAVELAKQLVSPDGDVLLVFVQVVMRAPGPDTDPKWQLDDRRRALERLASVGDDANAEADLLTVQAGSVARGLHEAVRRHGDLLVVGASRRDGYERTFVGDDTRQVLKDAPSAVAVAPNGMRDAPAFTRHHPASGTTPHPRASASPASERALTVASALARERGAELGAFEAVAEPIYGSDPVSGQWALEARLEKVQKRWLNAAMPSRMLRRVTRRRPWHGMRRRSTCSSSVPTSTG